MCLSSLYWSTPKPPTQPPDLGGCPLCCVGTTPRRPPAPMYAPRPRDRTDAPRSPLPAPRSRSSPTLGGTYAPTPPRPHARFRALARRPACPHAPHTSAPALVASLVPTRPPDLGCCAFAREHGGGYICTHMGALGRLGAWAVAYTGEYTHPPLGANALAIQNYIPCSHTFEPFRNFSYNLSQSVGFRPCPSSQSPSSISLST